MVTLGGDGLAFRRKEDSVISTPWGLHEAVTALLQLRLRPRPQGCMPKCDETLKILDKWNSTKSFGMEFKEWNVRRNISPGTNLAGIAEGNKKWNYFQRVHVLRLFAECLSCSVKVMFSEQRLHEHLRQTEFLDNTGTNLTRQVLMIPLNVCPAKLCLKRVSRKRVMSPRLLSPQVKLPVKFS